MKLFLLRHGKAEDHHSEGDAARQLVEKGRGQAARAAALIRKLELEPSIVLTSPRVRCVQTAEVFCEEAGISAPVVQPWLDCGMSVHEALHELTAFQEFSSVMLVGHEPDLSGFVQGVLGVASGMVEVKKGALVLLEVDPPGKSGLLRWVIPPAVIS